MIDMTENLLTIDEILQADDLKRDVVDVPEWGGSVEVRELTAAERNRIGAMMIDAKGNQTMERVDRVQVLAATFGLGLSEDKADAIGAKSGEAVQRIADKVMEISGMRPASVEDAEDFLPGSQNGDSPSD